MQEPVPPFHLTEGLRTTLKEGIGTLITDSDFAGLCGLLNETNFPIAAVGDTTTLRLIGHGVTPDLSIVDLGTRRGVLNSRDMGEMESILSSGNVVEIKNPPAVLTKGLWEVIRDFYKKFKIRRPERMGTAPLIIRVFGEEDLAALPCIYFSQAGGHVLYGLPDKGLVHVQVNETHKIIVCDALRKMEAMNGPQGNQSDRESTA